jgi:hypothetical protein
MRHQRVAVTGVAGFLSTSTIAGGWLIGKFKWAPAQPPRAREANSPDSLANAVAGFAPSAQPHGQDQGAEPDVPAGRARDRDRGAALLEELRHIAAAVQQLRLDVDSLRAELEEARRGGAA